MTMRTQRRGMARIVAVVAAGAAVMPAVGQSARVTEPNSNAMNPPLAPVTGKGTFKQAIPSAAYEIEMVLIAGDAAGGIKAFWISRTEVTWDAFDVFIYRLDEGGEQGAGGAGGAGDMGAAASADAVTRPSKPYLPPDRGFGHEGFAAITMSHANATAFCEWLSSKSGKRFRLASEDEWEHACGGAPTDLSGAAWHAANAEGKPHRVGGKAANAHGLHDMLGNVAEWVNGRDGKPVVKGGSYRDGAEQMTPAARQVNSRAWNASDPQIPKSKWWLADAPFIGFRMVCEVESKDEAPRGSGSGEKQAEPKP